MIRPDLGRMHYLRMIFLHDQRNHLNGPTPLFGQFLSSNLEVIRESDSLLASHHRLDYN